MHSEMRRGELSAYGAALLWSLFPIVTVLTVTHITPLYSAAISTLFSALFFAVTMTWKKRWHQLLRRDAWLESTLFSLFIGVIFYALIFIGYRHTTAGNGALVGLMEVFFAFVLLNVFLKHERFDPLHALGGVCMVIGAAIILLPSSGHWNSGDLLIFVATAFPPIGNMFGQRARKKIAADTLMFFRSVIAGTFLFLLAALTEPLPSLVSLQDAFWLLVFSGVLLLGFSKILWIEAIHRLPIAKTVALTEIEVLLTLLLAIPMLHQSITSTQLFSVAPMLLGVFLLTRR